MELASRLLTSTKESCRQPGTWRLPFSCWVNFCGRPEVSGFALQLATTDISVEKPSDAFSL